MNKAIYNFITQKALIININFRVSILFNNPEFIPEAVPYPVNPPTPVDPPTVLGETQKKPRVKWVVGQYESSMQLDLWARNKEERDDLTDAIFNALNPNITPMGLTLELQEYFGVLADFLYTGHNFEDTEVASQTDEWRTIMTVLFTCKAVRERKEFIIEDSQLDLETATVSEDDPFIPA